MRRKYNFKKITQMLCCLVVTGVVTVCSVINVEAVNVKRGSERYNATMSLTRLSGGKVSNGKYHSHVWKGAGSFALGSKKVTWRVKNKSYNMTLDGMVIIYPGESGGGYRQATTFENYY